METLNTPQMSLFLKRVQQLRGYGDMDSYVLVNEFMKFANVPEKNLTGIIEDFSSPKTWIFGKRKLINDVETMLGHTPDSETFPDTI
ncbi:hypothetical protein [Pedobacter rhodius]|uniref:Uncharacterized protein n=1 Tax=Pedobacter rhodius TaxID=3004098 RepID=A0ABT4KUH6_9SPHI|nr:hypothetical protein [Pedobacter sp. SJ11]MCZ4222589.1 hypothetical protein [Pedobacter sp. SJ11]